MKFIITGENGKSIEVDLTPEQMEALGLSPTEKPTGYEMPLNSRFFCQLHDGTALEEIDETLAKMCWCNATGYSDERLAEANARADLLMRKLRRYAAQHGGMPSVEDWPECIVDASKKYYIYFYAGKIRMDQCSVTRTSGCIYFLDPQACLDAIDEFKDELIWYFTEYEPMLH